ncbi:MAG: hypothetical protein DMD60_04350 [Gemmatimonadetes bacterium]|nr:MAG: hypothetical protein DMD60_04350 [Gemmatimonadota bacterium]
MIHQAAAVWHTLSSVPPAAIALVLLLALCQLALQALRLWAILPRHVALTLARTAHAFTLGEWVNLFTPARAGDALKVVLVHRAAKDAAPLSLSTATGAILADKIVDAGSLVLLCVGAGLAGFTGLMRAGVDLPGAGTLALVGGAGLLLPGVAWIWPRSRRWLSRMRRELMHGLAALTNLPKLLAAVGFSLGAWLAELVALGVLCGSIGPALAPPQLVLALALLNIGITVPVSIANLGVYEAALAFGLTRSGVPLSAAVAIATLHHAVQLVGTNLGAGAVSLWWAGRRPAAVRG